MSKHEQHLGHPATAAGKAGGCCGGAHDHESAKPEANAAKQTSNPTAASPGHAAHATGGSCGCGSKHK